jgi:phytoene dehydrogenase-like protein
VSPRPTGERTVVVGAGPAGLTAALELARLGRPAVVFEADDVVGGISRSVVFQGCRMDIGGHRFYTKVPEIEALWRQILGDDLLVRERLSRIHYRGHFFDYPLKPLNALRGLGVLESARVVGSYLRAQAFPLADESTFDAGSPTGSGGACSRSSSRPTPRRCGGCGAPRSARRGPPSAS